MSAQPKPTGEWTPATVKQYIGVALSVANPNEAFRACERLADAHNTELDAQQKERAIIERSRDAWQHQVTGLAKQLAAERERIRNIISERNELAVAVQEWKDASNEHAAMRVKLREQLDAERKEHAKALLAKQTRIEIFQQQLDAEREKLAARDLLVKQLYQDVEAKERRSNEIWEELSAERAVTNPLVDALEWAWTIIANAGGGDWQRESREWQDAAAKWRDEAWHHALAKVKEGKV